MSTPRGQPGIPIEEALASIHRSFSPLLAPFVERTKGDTGNRIVFVGPERGAGTTTVATCAALTLVRSFRVDAAVIEANLYAPRMASYLGLPDSPGLLDVADGRSTLEQALRNSQLPGLYVLSAGSHRCREEGRLASPAVRELLRCATARHRYSILDAPPLLEYPESCSLLEASEVILVVCAGRTTKQHAKTAVQLIQDAGARLLGVFLNRYRSHRPFGIGGG